MKTTADHSFEERLLKIFGLGGGVASIQINVSIETLPTLIVERYITENELKDLTYTLTQEYKIQLEERNGS